MHENIKPYASTHAQKTILLIYLIKLTICKVHGCWR